MYGLNVEPNSPTAVFIKSDSAHKAAQRLGFSATKHVRLRVSQKFSRGALQGWTVTMQGKDGDHTITDADVDRFGL